MLLGHLLRKILVDLGKIDLVRVDLVKVDFERVDLERLNCQTLLANLQYKSTIIITCPVVYIVDKAIHKLLIVFGKFLQDFVLFVWPGHGLSSHTHDDNAPTPNHVGG